MEAANPTARTTTSAHEVRSDSYRVYGGISEQEQRSGTPRAAPAGDPLLRSSLEVVGGGCLFAVGTVPLLE